MEQLYFDTTLTGNSDFFQYNQHLQPAFQYQDDQTFDFENSAPELASVDLEASQEYLNVLYLQNELFQAQQLHAGSALVTPTDEFTPIYSGEQSHPPAWYGGSSEVTGTIEFVLPLTPVDTHFEIKSPFVINSSVQASTLLKTRSSLEQHKSLSEVAGNAGVHRSASTSSNPFYDPNEYVRRMTSPPGLDDSFSKDSESTSRKVSSASKTSPKTSLKISSTFIREYNNKRISKFIKGTKKTNKGYKNFINYKCTGDNFERD